MTSQDYSLEPNNDSDWLTHRSFPGSTLCTVIFLIIVYLSAIWFSDIKNCITICDIGVILGGSCHLPEQKTKEYVKFCGRLINQTSGGLRESF